MGIEPDWRLAGPDLARMPFLKASWLPKIVVEAAPYPELDGPCWLWRGAKDSSGYSVVSIGPRITRKFWSLHKWVFHQVNGSPPPDHDVDHQCRRRLCFQPGHLRCLPMLKNRVPAYVQDEIELSPADLAALADPYWAFQLNRQYA